MTKCINKHEFVARYWSLLVSHTLSLHLLTASPAQLSALSTWTTLKSLSTESLRSSVTASQLGRLSLMNRFLHPGKLSGAHFLWFRFQLTVAPFNEFFFVVVLSGFLQAGQLRWWRLSCRLQVVHDFPWRDVNLHQVLPANGRVGAVDQRPAVLHPHHQQVRMAAVSCSTRTLINVYTVFFLCFRLKGLDWSLLLLVIN